MYAAIWANSPELEQFLRANTSPHLKTWLLTSIAMIILSLMIMLVVSRLALQNATDKRALYRMSWTARLQLISYFIALIINFVVATDFYGIDRSSPDHFIAFTANVYIYLAICLWSIKRMEAFTDLRPPTFKKMSRGKEAISNARNSFVVVSGLVLFYVVCQYFIN